MDLRKLGLSYSDIMFQAKVDPEFLSNVFGSLDFPVPKPPRSAATATATATTTTTTTTTTTEKRPASSSSATANHIPAKDPTLNTNEPPSRPKSASTISQSQVPSRAPSRFGSDRWSQKLNIEVSDEEDSDNDSNTAEKQPSLNGSGSSKPNASLKEKQRLEKEINDLMRKMEVQKAVKSQQKKASVTPPVVDSQPSSSGASTPVDSTRTSTTPAAGPAQGLRDRWAQALKKREEVRKRVLEYENKLREFNVGNIEQEVEQLKRLLEDKMKAVMEAAYQSASVRAQHEAAERENAAAENEVRELEQQVLEIERQQQQQEEYQRQRDEEIHINAQKKETVDDNLHEECAAEEMELDDQPLQPTKDVAVDNSAVSGEQEVSMNVTESQQRAPLTNGQEDPAPVNSSTAVETETVQTSTTVQNHEQNTLSYPMQTDRQAPSQTGEESSPIEIASSQPEDEEMSEADELIPDAKIKGEEVTQTSTTVSSGKHVEVVDLLSDSENESQPSLEMNENHCPENIQPPVENETHSQENIPPNQPASTNETHVQQNPSPVDSQFEDAHSPEPPSQINEPDVAEKENQPNEAEQSSIVADEIEHPLKRKFYDMELVGSKRLTKNQDIY